VRPKAIPKSKPPKFSDEMKESEPVEGKSSVADDLSVEIIPAEVKKIETTADKTAVGMAYPADGKISAGKPVEQRTSSKTGQSTYSPAAIDRNLVSLLEPQSYESEQFKILRTNILYPLSGKPPRSILITSALPEEGKSFVASNLAISIALNINQHVLLMDCDLRKPELHRRFGFSEGPGLSDYLNEGVPLNEMLLKTEVNKLTILPGGPPPENPSELMSSERMEALLIEVMDRYSDRLIVIDSPPPGMAAETGVLSRQVDGIILVIKQGKTPQNQLGDLIETVGKEKIIGTVINHMDRVSSRYYGYGKYGRYGKRYKK
jgi:exopolysaccharide/PEP-CTERM locus tyrosine autokinase